MFYLGQTNENNSLEDYIYIEPFIVAMEKRILD